MEVAEVKETVIITQLRKKMGLNPAFDFSIRWMKPVHFHNTITQQETQI